MLPAEISFHLLAVKDLVNRSSGTSFRVINLQIGSIFQAEIPWSVRIQQRISVKNSKSAPIDRHTIPRYQVLQKEIKSACMCED
jgi:hypothetical protein